MTTIVSDTSPINYLVLIGAIDVLPKLFDEVLIPPAVHFELQNPRTPSAVFRWAASLPTWARVLKPSTVDRAIALGAGETEAISLAVELGVSTILIDERKGSLAAEQRGLVPVGTLNVLNSADRRGFLDLEECVAKLRETSFYVDDALVDVLLREARARKNP